MKKFLSGLMVAGLMFASLTASNALTFFAQLNQIGTGTPYVWNNDGLFPGSGTFGTNPSPLNVTFQFQLPVPVIGTNIVPAQLVISAVNSGTMVGPQQPLEQLSFKVVATNPADFIGGNNVLLETILPVPLPAGIQGSLDAVGNTAFLNSDFVRGLVMRSDYIAIDPNDNQTATWSFSNVVPSPLTPDFVNGILQDTVFSGNGNFSATVRNIVPEPGSVAMLASFGVGGGLLLIRRRRNR